MNVPNKIEYRVFDYTSRQLTLDVLRQHSERVKVDNGRGIPPTYTLTATLPAEQLPARLKRLAAIKSGLGSVLYESTAL